MNEKYIYRKCLYNPKTLHVPHDQNRNKKITSEAKHFLEKIINESEHIDY